MKRVRWCRRWERAERGDGQHLQQGLPTRCHSAQQTYSKDNTTGCRTVANRTPCGRVGIAGALNAQRQRPWATNEPHWCTPGLLASRRRAFSTGCRLCGPRGLRPAPPAISATVWTSPAGVSAYTKTCAVSSDVLLPPAARSVLWQRDSAWARYVCVRAQRRIPLVQHHPRRCLQLESRQRRPALPPPDDAVHTTGSSACLLPSGLLWRLAAHLVVLAAHTSARLGKVGVRRVRGAHKRAADKGVGPRSALLRLAR